MSQIGYFERVKIQAEILLPLFRRLREELGEAKACALVRASVREFATQFGASVRQEAPGTSLDKLRTLIPGFAADNALKVEPVRDDAKELQFNVRGCRYADYFHALGEPLLGAMLTCEIDPPMTEAIGEDLGLQRTQTLMGGGSHCDFRWHLKAK